MFEFIYAPKKKKAIVEDRVDSPTKRAFMQGTAALMAVPFVPPLIDSIEKLQNPDIIDREIGAPLAGANPVTEKEPVYEESQSAYFKGKVEIAKPEFEQDMPAVLDKVEILAAIHTHFKLPGIDSSLVRSELESLVYGIAIAESRLNVDAENDRTKAFSFMQIMPETWNDLVREGESPDSIVDVIKIAARLMEQEYQHITATCQSELAMIRDVFFDGDITSFETDFLVPVLGNAYNAGMGSLATLIQWFAKNFQTKESTLALFDEVYILTGWDVFLGMTEQAKVQGNVVKWYKKEAVEYTPKIYAAKQVLEKYFTENHLKKI